MIFCYGGRASESILPVSHPKRSCGPASPARHPGLGPGPGPGVSGLRAGIERGSIAAGRGAQQR